MRGESQKEAERREVRAVSREGKKDNKKETQEFKEGHYN